MDITTLEKANKIVDEIKVIDKKLEQLVQCNRLIFDKSSSGSWSQINTNCNISATFMSEAGEVGTNPVCTLFNEFRKQTINLLVEEKQKLEKELKEL